MVLEAPPRGRSVPTRTAWVRSSVRPVGLRPRWPAGFMSRVATTPSWWRRSGAMTCATLGWSWSTSAASTTSPASWLTSHREKGGGSGSSSITWCLGARSAHRGPGRSGAGSGHVLVLGHPYVDIWQAVKPARLGLAGWPEVPRTVEWKRGICAALGLRTGSGRPGRGQEDDLGHGALLGRPGTPLFRGRTADRLCHRRSSLNGTVSSVQIRGARTSIGRTDQHGGSARGKIETG